MASERGREGASQIVAGSSNQRIGGSRAIRCGWYTSPARARRAVVWHTWREMRKEGRERGREAEGSSAFAIKRAKDGIFVFPSARPLSRVPSVPLCLWPYQAT